MRLLLVVFAALISSTAFASGKGEGEAPVQVLENPGHPHKSKEIVPPEIVKMKLVQVSMAKNQIIDEEQYFKQLGVPVPITGPGTGSEVVEQVNEFGKLKFFRPLPDDFRLAIYVKETMGSKAAKNLKLATVYDREFEYTIILLDSDNTRLRIISLKNFFADFREMNNIAVVGTTLYFDINHNGYAADLKNKTGYLVALDVYKAKVLWSSPALTSSFRGFLVVGDYIIAGYGFTAEPDFLFLVNRHTGEIVQKEKIKTMHDYIIPKDGKLHVRCYDTNYVYELK